MSEIVLNATDLKPVMQGLGKIIRGKSTLPVLENVRIARKNNTVTLQATDLDAWASYRTEQRGEDAVFFVPFATLNRIVARVYAGLDQRLLGAAALSARAHIDHLIAQGRIRETEGRFEPRPGTLR